MTKYILLRHALFARRLIKVLEDQSKVAKSWLCWSILNSQKPHTTTLILMFYWFCWNCLSQSTRSDDNIPKYWLSEKLTQANREGVDGVGIGAVWGLRLRLSAARKGVLSSLIFLKSPLGHCVNTILGRKTQNREPHIIVQDVVHIQINDKTHCITIHNTPTSHNMYTKLQKHTKNTIHYKDSIYSHQQRSLPWPL